MGAFYGFHAAKGVAYAVAAANRSGNAGTDSEQVSTEKNPADSATANTLTTLSHRFTPSPNPTKPL